jgi:hypothetical protein
MIMVAFPARPVCGQVLIGPNQFTQLVLPARIIAVQGYKKQGRKLGFVRFSEQTLPASAILRLIVGISGTAAPFAATGPLEKLRRRICGAGW